MARIRYQRGTVILRGKVTKVWVGRWREDELKADGTVYRRRRSEILGTIADYPTRRLALRALELKVMPVNSKDYRPRVSITFEDFAEKWQETVLVNHKPSTQEVTRSGLKCQILPYLGTISLKDISTAMLQTYVTKLPGEPKSKKNVVGIVKTMWKQAKAWGYVTHNPFEGLVLPTVYQKEQPFFTAEDMRAIIAAAEGQWKAFFWLAAETGMREGELIGFRPEDFDAEKGVVQVRQSVWRNKVQSPKSERGRRAYLISHALRVALEHFLVHVRLRDGDVRGMRFAFTNEKGKVLNHNAVYDELQRTCERAGVKPAGMHAFRHGNSSIMDRWGIPAKLRQQRLGHADERMMMRYSHVATADEIALADRFGELFSQEEVRVQ